MPSTSISIRAWPLSSSGTASTDVPKGQDGQAVAAQKLTIARMLFAWACSWPSRPPPTSSKGLDPASSVFAEKVLQTQPYKDAARRVSVVCGVRMMLSAIGEEFDRSRNRCCRDVLAV